MKQIKIIGQSVVVTDMALSKIIFDAPKEDIYYDLHALTTNSAKIKLVYKTGVKITDKEPPIILLSEAVDASETPFTAETFSAFVHDNLGFKTASGGSGVAHLGEELAGAFADIPNASIDDFTIAGSPSDALITSTGVLKFTPENQWDQIKVSISGIDPTKNYLIDWDVDQGKSSSTSLYINLSNTVFTTDANDKVVSPTVSTVQLGIEHRANHSFGITSYIRWISIKEILE